MKTFSSCQVKTVVEGIEHIDEIISGKARNHDTRCLSMVSFKLLPVTPSVRAPGGFLGPSAPLPDSVQKENFLLLPEIEPQFFGRPAPYLVSMLTHRSSYSLLSVYLMTFSIARILKRHEDVV
jgi:hypothetical protein